VGRHHHPGAVDPAALSAPIAIKKQRFLTGKTLQRVCYTLLLCYVPAIEALSVAQQRNLEF
jgi:hypothetical protein